MTSVAGADTTDKGWRNGGGYPDLRREIGSWKFREWCTIGTPDSVITHPVLLFREISRGLQYTHYASKKAGNLCTLPAAFPPPLLAFPFPKKISWSPNLSLLPGKIFYSLSLSCTCTELLVSCPANPSFIHSLRLSLFYPLRHPNHPPSTPSQPLPNSSPFPSPQETLSSLPYLPSIKQIKQRKWQNPVRKSKNGPPQKVPDGRPLSHKQEKVHSSDQKMCFKGKYPLDYPEQLWWKS